jgi:hypothetical protein
MFAETANVDYCLSFATKENKLPFFLRQFRFANIYIETAAYIYIYIDIDIKIYINIYIHSWAQDC